MYWVYALLSLKDGSVYVGMTSNWVQRFQYHEAGFVISTRDRRPFRVIYLEEVPTRKRARQLEVYLKSGEGRRFLRARMAGAETVR